MGRKRYKYTSAKEAKLAAEKKRIEYKKTKTTALNVRFSNRSDADILAKLESVENKTDYLRGLIRDDINVGGS